MFSLEWLPAPKALILTSRIGLTSSTVIVEGALDLLGAGLVVFILDVEYVCRLE